MSEHPYRVIQWATGTVGQAAMQHFIENPTYELVGCFVTNPEKVGKDAADIIGGGLPQTGVLASNDADALIAMDADCVMYAALSPDFELFERILRSGKNIVSPVGPYYPTERYADAFAKLEAACQEAGVSIYGSGIHPGFASDILPATLSRLMHRVDSIQVYEIVDKLRNPMVWIDFMGFGADPEELLANPRRSAEAPHHFAQCMTLVLDSLGVKMDELTTKFEVAKAMADIPYAYGVIKQGMVAGQHYEWTAWVDGVAFMTYHFYWTMGENIEPRWDNGESCYRIVIQGDPPMEVRLMGLEAEDGRRPFHGLPWTGLLCATSAAAVCDAEPGVLTHLDLGIVQPRGLVRRPMGKQVGAS